MTRQPSKWIEIDPSKYDEDKSVEQSGVRFHVYMSPYSMPDAVRGEYDVKTERFVIEFKYIEDENTDSEAVSQFITAFVGRESRRLYRIEIDVEKLGANAVALTLSHAIDNLSERLGRGRAPAENFRVAKEVLVDNQRELLRGLAVTG